MAMHNTLKPPESWQVMDYPGNSCSLLSIYNDADTSLQLNICYTYHGPIQTYTSDPVEEIYSAETLP